MREIKFRAWHSENKSFVYQSLSDFWRNGWICATHTRNADYEIPHESNSFSVHGEWEQYTGLKDKNGREIYDGDIVKINMGRIDDGVLLITFGGPWDYAGFGLTGKRTGWEEGDFDPPECWDTLKPQYAAALEIIGNIHENPELLS
jgi:uncharacterized phage protein (TIGR01671 family)